MHRLVMTFIGVLVAPLLMALVGCGGGGGGAGMGSPDDARIVLANVITAGFENDFAKARPYLDTGEWLTSVADPQASAFATLPADEQQELQKRHFGMVKQVTQFANLPDAASILSAVQSASVEPLPQLKIVRFQFTAPDREKPGELITVKAKMRHEMDGVWRLSKIDVDF
jgi:hypothetical protein